MCSFPRPAILHKDPSHRSAAGQDSSLSGFIRDDGKSRVGLAAEWAYKLLDDRISSEILAADSETSDQVSPSLFLAAALRATPFSITPRDFMGPFIRWRDDPKGSFYCRLFFLFRS